MPAPQPDLHLILPFVASLSEPCQQALPRLDDARALPQLHRLLARLGEAHRADGDEYALSMPHERLCADALGWADLPDGTLPWAAFDAQSGEAPGEAGQACGWLTPCHWLVGRESLTLIDPEELRLTEPESRALLEVLRPWFEEDGWALKYDRPTRWRAAHPSLAGLPTASLDRVIGRNPDVWMPDHPQARLIKRLQNEVQMLMHDNPLNAEREANGRLPVNSFWLSGTGALPESPLRTAPPGQRLISELRAPLLASNLADWIDTWRALDATVLKEANDAADQGRVVRLSLCGERSAVTLAAPSTTSLARRLVRQARRLMRANAVQPSALLSTL